MVKSPTANAGDIRDTGWIPRSERSPGEGHGNPLQYSCLENPMDKGARQGTVHRVAKSQTRLKQFSTHACMDKYCKGLLRQEITQKKFSKQFFTFSTHYHPPSHRLTIEITSIMTKRT